MASWSLDGLAGRLVEVAGSVDELSVLFERFATELAARGAPVVRMTLGVEILHPEVSGAMFVWRDAAKVTVSTTERPGVLERASYRDSPTRVVDETDRPFRRRLDGPQADMPILEELRGQGITDYLMVPLPFLDRSRTATMSFATQRPGGFELSDVEALDRAAHFFSPYAERHVLRRIAADLLDTYVGARSGRRIIAGSIERGSVERIEAAIVFADLRGFTAFSEAEPVERVVAVLDAWFQEVVGAVERHGGEVLKFIGDAVLGIFPVTPERSRREACADAFAAALAAVGSRERGSGERTPLDFALALHVGEVAYGNVGAARRLDFTVIGRAVNRTARLQDLAKALGRRVVVSEEVASELDGPLVDLGSHRLRGIEGSVHAYGLP